MVFSDSTNKQGIVEEIDFLISTDSTSYPTAQKTRNVNRWYDKALGWIMEASNPRFQFDDSKYTTTPVFTTALVAGQSQYAFDSTWLDIDRVDLLDENGHWRQLSSLDQSDVYGGYDEHETTNGTPYSFDIISNVLELHPAPSYSLARSLKVWAKRKGSYFAAGDTTTEPGFAPQFHRILSLGAAYDYALAKGLSQVKMLREEIEQMHREIDDFYGERTSEKLRIRPAYLGYNESR